MNTISNTKVILISTFPLPYSKIGSWTTLYKNYIENDNQIDYIVCEKPSTFFQNCIYQILDNSFPTKILSKIVKNPRLKYLKAIEKIVKKEEKYVIQIVDNFGLIKPLISFLKKKGIRKKCYLQFFFHGYSPFYEDSESRFFFESIDEMVLLTNDSYQLHKNYYTVLPCRFSVLNNGIDTTKFYSLESYVKNKLREKKGVSQKKVFIWCSQDRPKKGLSIILDAWKRVYSQRQDIILWVIGANSETEQQGVTFFGKIPNDKLPEYFQLSDCYLFPTLCQEGFGMTLIEALHCGNYCIASAIGGVPEVLKYGVLGQLIQNPNFIKSWETAIIDYIDNPKQINAIATDLYSTQSWNNGMNEIISSAKLSL